ncbi:MAG: tetratricopeptide repeat protein [Lachnospiraceae bacterium]|nr:tetratricopeptide repeat protein [Lachnospiraceae bacterium]
MDDLNKDLDINYSEQNNTELNHTELNDKIQQPKLKVRKKLPLWLPIAAVAAIIIAILAGMNAYSSSPAQKMKKQLSLGERYLTELNFEQAVAAYTEALKIDPDNTDAKEALVQTYLAWAESLGAAGDTERAIDVLEQGIEKTDDARLKEKLDDLKKEIASADTGSLFEQAQALLDEEKYQDAIDVYQAILAIDPVNADAYLGIVECYIGMGKLDEALQWAKEGFDKTGDQRLKEKIEMLESDTVTDNKGRPVKSTHYDANGTMIWYSINGLGDEGIRTTTNYDPSGAVVAEYQNEFDEEGRIIVSYSVLSDSGKLANRNIMTYENGLNVRRDAYSVETGDLVCYELMQYDADGKNIRTDTYNCISPGYENHNYYLYQFDENGRVCRYDCYDDDGTLKFYQIDERDENGKPVKSVVYEADGSVRSTIVHE